jgi:hypothetical protein
MFFFSFLLIDANYLTRFMLLLDLEVAKRLYRREGEITHEYDDLPIGVAIAVINQTMETDPDFHFRLRFIFQIFQGTYENRRAAIDEVLNNLVFHSPTGGYAAEVGKVRVKWGRFQEP